MDLVTVGLAAAALLATKFGEGFAKDAGETTWESVRRLSEIVFEKFKGDPNKELALSRVKSASPGEAVTRELGQYIEAEARMDPRFASQVTQLVEDARKYPANKAIIAQAFAKAKQVNIGGDNFGPINF